MPKSSACLKKFYYFLLLFIIYPLSPFLFTAFLNFREPVFSSPIDIKGRIQVRSDALGGGYFGARRSGGARRHKGLDITAKIGEPVLACKSGVAETGLRRNGMGKYVKLKHRGDFVTVYGHLSKIAVENNQWVWRGAKIGEVGKTGNASSKSIQPHLHFEIRQKNKYLDPLKYMR